MGQQIGLHMRRLGGALFLCATATTAHAQASGFNVTVAYAHGLIQHDVFEGETSPAVGLAYQHDLSQRFGIGLEAVLGFDGFNSAVRSYEGIYSAKYFFSDNEGTTGYIGSFIGVQSLKAEVTDHVLGSNGYSIPRTVEASKIQVPIGIRVGLRGGLDGYFGELFVQAGYALGNGILYKADGDIVKTTPLYFSVGGSFLGFGWDHKGR